MQVAVDLAVVVLLSAQRRDSDEPDVDAPDRRAVFGNAVLQRPANDLASAQRRGFLYLVAIIDWYTRKVLAWRISNTLEADFCVEALNEAMAKYGAPEIMNTDQGSQFTSFAWTDRLRRSGVRISMEARAGSWTTSSSNGSGNR